MDSNFSRETTQRPVRQQRTTFLKGTLIAALSVCGALVFCGVENLTSATAARRVALYVGVMTIIAAGAVYIRLAYGKHLANLRDDITRHRRLVRNLAADVALMATLTFGAVRLCDLLCDTPATISDWGGCALYFGLVTYLARLLTEDTQTPATETRPIAMPAEPHSDGLVSSDLNYIEAEDHYVKFVYRDRVEHKRARFRDVINGLGQSGYQVHKSFWVNYSVVRSSRRAGRRMVLVLNDGTEIPVGRGNERMVSDALAARKGGIRAQASPDNV